MLNALNDSVCLSLSTKILKVPIWSVNVCERVCVYVFYICRRCLKGPFCIAISTHEYIWIKLEEENKITWPKKNSNMFYLPLLWVGDLVGRFRYFRSPHAFCSLHFVKWSSCNEKLKKNYSLSVVLVIFNSAHKNGVNNILLSTIYFCVCTYIVVLFFFYSIFLVSPAVCFFWCR